MFTKCQWEILNRRDHVEDLDVDGRNNIKMDVHWIHVAEDRVQWQALMNTVMSLRVLQKAVNFLTSYETISCSVELHSSRTGSEPSSCCQPINSLQQSEALGTVSVVTRDVI
jgi:hypothetical protein